MQTLKKDPLLNEITFDGIRFWFRDIVLGKISSQYQFNPPIPKNVMQEYKHKFIDEIMNFCEV